MPLIDKGNIKISNKASAAKADELLSLMVNAEGAKAFSKQHFDAISNPKIIPTGSLLYHVDEDYHLILNNPIESKFLRFLASSGLVSSIRGQCFEVPYVKPWAHTPSPYYPDFLVHLSDGRIAIIEIKSILGMCQDENIVKFEYLISYCKRRGYMCAFIDADHLPFGDYLWPLGGSETEDLILLRLNHILSGTGGINQTNLEDLLASFPKYPEKEMKRLVSSFILQNPYLTNRYCHDSPYLINAVKAKEPLGYKKFS